MIYFQVNQQKINQIILIIDLLFEPLIATVTKKLLVPPFTILKTIFTFLFL